jgi:hypothetical protein
MKKRRTTTRELSKVVTSFTVYKFIKDITTPFTELKSFDRGEIDKNGNFIIDPKKITPYDRLIVNLKKLLGKIPDPMIKARLKYLTSAIVLFVEETEKYGANPDIVFNEISEFLIENGLNIDEALTSLNEDMIANSVSGGGIVGVRGNPDETIVNQMAHLKRMKKLKRRKKPTYLRIGTSNDPY